MAQADKLVDLADDLAEIGFAVSGLASRLETEGREEVIAQVVVVERGLADEPAGSTLSMVFLRGDKLYLAVLGDSPVLVYAADDTLYTSPEHNVARHPGDVAAISARCVEQLLCGALRVDKDFLTLPRSGAQLQSTRALGDPDYASILGREPDILEYVLPDGGVVIVASDAISISQDAEKRQTFYRAMAERAADGSDTEALGRFVLEPAHHVSDNLTVLVARVGKSP